MASKTSEKVRATGVYFVGNVLYMTLSDGREISVSTDRFEWLKWLADASPEQRAKWSLEPGGFAVYWNDLDDGIEVCHLLAAQPLA